MSDVNTTPSIIEAEIAKLSFCLDLGVPYIIPAEDEIINNYSFFLARIQVLLREKDYLTGTNKLKAKDKDFIIGLTKGNTVKYYSLCASLEFPYGGFQVDLPEKPKNLYQVNRQKPTLD